MLSVWARRTALAVAFVTLALGSIAVFRTSNQAGSVALLAASVALMLVGLLGRIPERGTVGQIAYTFGPTADRLESPDLAERENAAELVLEKAEENVRSLEPNARAVIRASKISRGRLLTNLLASIAEEMGLQTDVQPRVQVPDLALSPGVHRFISPDLRIAPGPKGDHFVPFPVEINTGTDSRRVREALRLLAECAEAMGSGTALMIWSKPGTTVGWTGESPYGEHVIAGVRVLIVASPEDELDLVAIREGLRRAIAQAATGT
jgi:hypothetical protein